MSVKKPIVLYDKKCGFCRRRILSWGKITKNDILYKPSESLKKIIFIKHDGVFSGARAVLEILAPYSSIFKLLLFFYKRCFLNALFEFVYRLISSNRLLISKVW
jgi:predicted DCC family thiol-disulfide oxidoreductase YuxK